MAGSPETRFKLILHHVADHRTRTLIYSGSHVKIYMKVTVRLNFHAEPRSQARPSLPREARVRHWRLRPGPVG